MKQRKPQQQSQNVFQKECLADTSASILSKSFQIILQIHTLETFLYVFPFFFISYIVIWNTHQKGGTG